MSESVRAHAIYSGTVQGVGFRYTVRRLASSAPVPGFVRNLPDGTVELVVEAPREELTSFLARIDHALAGYIRDKTLTFSAPTGEFRRFEITFSGSTP